MTDDKTVFLTTTRLIENHFLNWGIRGVHPALLLDLLTYREKSLISLKSLIQLSKGDRQKRKFYLGVYKILRDTIVNDPSDIVVKSSNYKKVPDYLLNNFVAYLKVIRINIKKIVSFLQWFKELETADKKHISEILAKNSNNIIFAKIIETLIFGLSKDDAEIIIDDLSKNCTPFSIVILREYSRVGLFSSLREKVKRNLVKFQKKTDCTVPPYKPVDEDLSRFQVYATQPSMSGSSLILAVRKESKDIVDFFTITYSVGRGIVEFESQEGVPTTFFNDYMKFFSHDLEKVAPEYLISIIKESVVRIKFLSIEPLPEFVFYRNLIGEESLIPDDYNSRDSKGVSKSSVDVNQMFNNKLIMNWIKNSIIIAQLIKVKGISSVDLLAEELSLHSGLIKESLSLLNKWAEYSGKKDAKQIDNFLKLADDMDFYKNLSKYAWKHKKNYE